jgi:nicotinate-nucleotide adenylyltransferase
VARAALDELKLEKILIMPTGAPRYRTPAVASGEHRLAMLKLALGDEPSYEIDARELGPGASGYTIDTLKELRLEYGTATEFWFLMGADQYARLDTWHRADDIRRMVKIGVFARPGSPSSAAGARVIPWEPMNISSSDIRARVARGKDISPLVPPAVANHIARERLYV